MADTTNNCDIPMVSITFLLVWAQDTMWILLNFVIGDGSIIFELIFYENEALMIWSYPSRSSIAQGFFIDLWKYILSIFYLNIWMNYLELYIEKSAFGDRKILEQSKIEKDSSRSSMSHFRNKSILKIIRPPPITNFKSIHIVSCAQTHKKVMEDQKNFAITSKIENIDHLFQEVWGN